MTEQPGVRFGLANGTLVLALLVAAAFGPGRSGAAVVAILVAALTSAALPRRYDGLLGVEAWAFVTGFFENRDGVLTLAPGDLVTLAAFVAATLVLAQTVRSVARAGARRG